MWDTVTGLGKWGLVFPESSKTSEICCSSWYFSQFWVSWSVNFNDKPNRHLEITFSSVLTAPHQSSYIFKWDLWESKDIKEEENNVNQELDTRNINHFSTIIFFVFPSSRLRTFVFLERLKKILIVIFFLRFF